jgi:hypothetical protein
MVLIGLVIIIAVLAVPRIRRKLQLADVSSPGQIPGPVR